MGVLRVRMGFDDGSISDLSAGQQQLTKAAAALGDRPPATTMEAASGGCFAHTTDGEKSLCQHEHTPVRL